MVSVVGPLAPGLPRRQVRLLLEEDQARERDRAGDEQPGCDDHREPDAKQGVRAADKRRGNNSGQDDVAMQMLHDSSSLCAARSGTTTTGQSARCRTSCETLPRTARTRPSPREPTTIASACRVSATPTIASAAGPSSNSIEQSRSSGKRSTASESSWLPRLCSSSTICCQPGLPIHSGGGTTAVTTNSLPPFTRAAYSSALRA